MSERNRKITLSPFEQTVIKELMQEHLNNGIKEPYIWIGKTTWLLTKFAEQLPKKEFKELLEAHNAWRSK